MENVCLQSQGAGRKDPEVVQQEADLASAVAENHEPTMAENCTPEELADADFSGGDVDKGSAPAASVPITSCSEFHSARIESMLSSRSEFETELEYRTAHSKVHWSELSHHELASSSEESGSGSGESGIGSEDQPGVDHSQYFEELQKDAIWGRFCSAITDVVLGKKLAEGAQGVIYEAQVTFARGRCSPREWKAGRDYGYVVKVMKSGYALEDLHRQWPQGLATLEDKTLGQVNFDLYGVLVKDHATGRNQFGFVMYKCWGDLRMLIDVRMERNEARGPPFSTSVATNYMIFIAWGMSSLHRRGIIHRDLKAANILVNLLLKDKENNIDLNGSCLSIPDVADWECSGGVMGTGFWRAPEVLQQLKDRTPSSEIVFTKEMDVYSFSMTCYEIVTGKLPFEGPPFKGLPVNEVRDAILDGARPELPRDIDPNIKAFICNCWDPNPSNRPRFGELIGIIKKIWLPKKE